MTRYLLLAGLLVVLVIVSIPVLRAMSGSTVLAQTTQPAVTTKALTYTVKDIDGQDYDLAQLKGKVVLIINVASKCGFTKQYTGLEALYEKYKDRGLVVLGFPANNFGGQEPGTEADIKEFCSTKFNVTFPMMSKISVKGDDEHPVYKALTENTGGFAGDIGWNFTKFLIARDGQTLLARFPSKVAPEDKELVDAVEKALRN